MRMEPAHLRVGLLAKLVLYCLVKCVQVRTRVDVNIFCTSVYFNGYIVHASKFGEPLSLSSRCTFKSANRHGVALHARVCARVLVLCWCWLSWCRSEHLLCALSVHPLRNQSHHFLTMGFAIGYVVLQDSQELVSVDEAIQRSLFKYAQFHTCCLLSCASLWALHC